MSYSILVFFIFIIISLIAIKDRFKALIICLVLYPTLEMFKLSGSFPVWGVMNILIFLSLFVDKNTDLKRLPHKGLGLLWLFSNVFSALWGSYNTLGTIMGFIQYPLFIPLVWILYKPSKVNDMFVVKIVCVYLLVSVIYGAYEAFTFTKPFMNWLISMGFVIEHTGEDFARLDLLRTSGLTPWGTYFAETCCCGYALINCFLNKKMSQKMRYCLLGISFICVFGVVISMDRSAMVVFFILAMGLNAQLLKNDFKLFLLVAFAAIVAYALYGNFIDEVIYTITHSNSKDVAGSSWEMRLGQMAAAWKFTEDSLLFGKGTGAIAVAVSKVPALLGGESLLYYVLINKGLFGVLVTFILFARVSYIYLKKKCLLIFLVFAALTLYNFVTLPIQELYALPFAVLLYKRYLYNSKDWQNYATKK